MKRILVLYKELAGYFIACLDELCEQHGVQADVVAYPVNADAPFQFKHSQRISLIARNTLTDDQLEQMIAGNSYDLIFTGGWFDKGYLKAIRSRKCPALLGFDNAWNGFNYLWTILFKAVVRIRFCSGNSTSDFCA